MRTLSTATLTAFALLPAFASAQETPGPVAAKRRADGDTDHRIPRTQSANLPTAETLRKGELLFEISHRFDRPFSSGSSTLWGLDGPVFMRLGLSYAATDRLMVGVIRSNLDDNLDLHGKLRLFEGGRDRVPAMVALAGGVAWNTETSELAGIENNEMQAYGELILNVRAGERVALGAVPALVHNPRLKDVQAENAFVLGLNGNVYLTSMFGLFGEWIVSGARQGLEHDTGSFGIELETGGHFFELMVTNSARPNPVQALVGSPTEFTPHEWRFGFNVTRLISLGR